MVVSNSTRRVARSVVGTLLVALGSTAFAAAPPASAPSTPTREMREKMALLHEQMAACLRSDKPISECRAQMRKSCHAAMGNQDCTTMMGMGGGMMGARQGMHRRMMSDTSSSPTPPK